jgi:hypothetical protein
MALLDASCENPGGGLEMRVQSASSRWLIVVAGGVVALVVLSVAVALLTRSEATTFAADTPEGTVQRYLQAIEDGELQEAYDYLSVALQRDCSYRDFRSPSQRSDMESQRVTLEDTERVNGEMEVRVLVTQFHVDPPFGSRESSHVQRYLLVEEGGEWRFSAQPWPTWCPKPAAPEPRPTPSPTPTAASTAD